MTTTERRRGITVPVVRRGLMAGMVRRVWTRRLRCEAITWRGGRCLNFAGYALRGVGPDADTLVCGIHRAELERNGSLEVIG